MGELFVPDTSNEIANRVVEGNLFSDIASIQDITLPTGRNYDVLDEFEIGSTHALEIPATSSAEIDAPSGTRIICTSTTRPSSPVNGLVIYETNTNMTWTGDGNRWCGPVYDIPMAAYTQINPQSAGTVYPFISALPTDYGVKLLRWTMGITQSASSGANYWTVTLQQDIQLGGAIVVLGTWVTSALTINVWNMNSVTTFTNKSILTAAESGTLYVKAVASGTPGNTYFTTNMRVQLVS